MDDDRVVRLLEEILGTQKEQLRLSQETYSKYEGVIRTHNKEVVRGKKLQIAYLVVILSFLGFLAFGEWFLNGNPRPSWMK
ncbi:MAG: hypothetical protein AABO41_24390 [Acidobacteriota bacterium]